MRQIATQTARQQRQARVAVSIASGDTIAAASRSTSISRSTIHRWMHNPAFRQAIDSAITERQQAERELIDRTVFSGYYYEWGKGEGALALGFGSLYNHSYKPTARYDQAEEGPVLIISAIRRINPGSEITINYNGNPRSRKRLWFDPAG